MLQHRVGVSGLDFKARPSELTQMEDFSWDQGGKLHLPWVVFEMALHCVGQAGLELLDSASASQSARIAEFGARVPPPGKRVRNLSSSLTT